MVETPILNLLRLQEMRGTGTMVPRIKIQRPSTSSLPDEIVLMGTGNDFNHLDTLESPRPRHHEEQFGSVQEEPDGDMDERPISWDDRAAFFMGEKASSWDERMRWWKLYSMHFLFMWNSRTFEYVSIVLIAQAFPHGLTATSIRGITSTVSAMLFAPAVGNWIDRSPSRLPSLLFTINFNHAAIVASYVCWFYWPVMAGQADEAGTSTTGPFSDFSKGSLYGFILLLDIIHDLSAIANRLSVERDWVPTLVGPITPDITYDLTQVNAVFIRIEHIVKLIAPSLLPLLMATFKIRAGWIFLLIGVTILLWIAEVWCARTIAAENPELRAAKNHSHDIASMEELSVEERMSQFAPGIRSWPAKLYFVLYQEPALRLKHFFSIRMWPASMSVSLLQLTVLAYSATLITYLLEVGFSLSLITIAKATGSITGLASTVITPMTVRWIRRRQALRESRGEIDGENEASSEGKIARKVGMWGIVSQFLCLIPVVLVLWNLSPPSQTAIAATDDSTSAVTSPRFFAPVVLFTFLSLSRIGHIAIQLMVQELGQVEIPASQRSSFAGSEQSFHSMGELCHWAMTIVWSHPSEFCWLALGSLVVVGVSMVVYGVWARRPVEGKEQEYRGIALVSVAEEDEEDVMFVNH